MLRALHNFIFGPDPEVAVLRELLAAADRENLALTKSNFLERMQAISSGSSAESASGSDTIRRGAPQLISLNDLFVGYNEGIVPRASSAWHNGLKVPVSLPALPIGLDENKDVHPFVRPFFQAAVSATKTLQLWSNVITSDDIPKAEIKPDLP